MRAAMVAWLAVAGGACPAWGQRVGDFVLPSATPDAAMARRVEAPGAIKRVLNGALEVIVIAGETVQDAVNAASDELRETGDGARFVSTPSGLGIVATASASYDRRLTNANLVLLGQREATMRAGLEARRRIVETIHGLGVEGRELLVEQAEVLDRADRTLVNAELRAEDRLTRVVSGFLRGAVTYEVVDDGRGVVRVTMVSTPRSQGSVRWGGGGGPVDAASLSAGLEAVFADVRGGVTPPTGATVVTVPTTGEVAWVAFGSELAREHGDAEIERELRQSAVRTAEVRAQRALVALLSGEQIEADDRIDDRFVRITREFDTLVDANGVERIEAREAAARETLVRQARESRVSGRVQGRVPPGAQTRAYESADGRWVYSIVVFTASAGDAAEGLRAQLEGHAPLGDVQRRARGFEVKADGTFATDERGEPILRPLPSGVVTGLDDL